MARTKGQTKPVKTVESAERRAARIAREERARRVQVGLGLVVVGGTVVAATVLAVTRSIPWPVAVGLTLLALFRGYALRRELRRESDPETPAEPNAKPGRRARLFAAGR